MSRPVPNYDTSRTDLRPGQPVIGGHKHAPKSRANSASKIDKIKSKTKKRKKNSRYVSLYSLPMDEDPSAVSSPPLVDAEEEGKPWRWRDYIMWKLIKIGRPRQP